MNPSIVVRQALAADAREIARLNTLFNDVTEPPEAYLPRLADPRRVDTPLLAEVEGKVVGFANLRLAHSVFYPEPYAELSELYVEEAYRRRGIGKALILHAEGLARQAGAGEMVILTGDDNQAALGLYRSLGYGDHDLALSKELKKE
jgi:ribosomal protein S18 acetylase RimI-like enzyme